MPFGTLKIQPSVDIEETLADNAAGVSESSFIRWRDNLPEKRGGWTKYVNYTFSGTPRELAAWEGFNSEQRLGVGTTSNLYVVYNGQVSDITAQATTVDIAVNIATTITSPDVVVTDTGRNATVYDAVVFNTHASIGGVMLFGAYQIVASGGANTYTITAAMDATSTTSGGATATFTATNGSNSVTVTLADHVYSAGQQISFPIETFVGGMSIYGQYIVQSVPSSSTFTINASHTAATVNVTGASGDGVHATVTYSGVYHAEVGDTIVVAGVNPAGYNATATITSKGANSFSYANATVAAYVSGGTIFNSISRENAGELNLTYYLTQGPAIFGTGFGVGGFGKGGFGTGVAAPAGATGTPITADDYWLANWGEVLLSCPTGGPLFVWDSTSGYETSALVPAAPIQNNGMFVAMPQQQVMLWGSTYNGLSDPLQIRWSDAGDYGIWQPSAINQAGGYKIPTGSKIVRGIQGATQTYWFTDVDLYAGQYVGQPYVWGFNKVGDGCGLIGPKAVAKLNTSIYWMSQKQFFVTGVSGGVQPIPCSVWDYVFQNLNTAYSDNIRAAANAQFNEITWFFPSLASNSGENDSYVTFNVLYNEWDYGALNRSAWIDQSLLGPPIGASSAGVLYQHETSNDADGTAINAYFKTGYFSIANGEDLVFVDRFLPDMKWGTYAAAQNASLQISFNVTDYAGDTPTTYGPFTVTQATQFIEPRFRGRFMQFVVESNDLGSFWRLGSCRYRYAPDGRL